MDIAAIGAASVSYHAEKLQQSVGVAMMKKTMDAQEASAAALIDTMRQAAPPGGHLLDVRA